MKSLLLALVLTLTGWMSFSSYWYTCKMKGLCVEEQDDSFYALKEAHFDFTPHAETQAESSQTTGSLNTAEDQIHQDILDKRSKGEERLSKEEFDSILEGRNDEQVFQDISVPSSDWNSPAEPSPSLTMNQETIYADAESLPEEIKVVRAEELAVTEPEPLPETYSEPISENIEVVAENVLVVAETEIPHEEDCDELEEIEQKSPELDEILVPEPEEPVLSEESKNANGAELAQAPAPVKPSVPTKEEELELSGTSLASNVKQTVPKVNLDVDSEFPAGYYAILGVYGNQDKANMKLNKLAEMNVQAVLLPHVASLMRLGVFLGTDSNLAEEKIQQLSQQVSGRSELFYFMKE